MTEKAFILSTRVEDLPNNPYAHLSSKVNCDLCRKEVWLAPSSMDQLKKNPTFKVVCDQCLINFLKVNPDEPLNLRMTEAAFNEVVSVLGREPDIENVGCKIREKAKE